MGEETERLSGWVLVWKAMCRGEGGASGKEREAKTKRACGRACFLPVSVTSATASCGRRMTPRPQVLTDHRQPGDIHHAACIAAPAQDMQRKFPGILSVSMMN